VDASCSTCNDGSITVNATGGTPSYTYSLIPAAGTLTDNPFSNVPPGNYQACVTDSNGCINCDTVSVSFSVFVESLALFQQVYFYPNPFSGEASFHVNVSLKEKTSLRITDALGRIVKELVITAEETPITRKDITESGIYFYSLYSNSKRVSVGKLIIVD